jgi:hypothetical protein
MKRRSNLLAAYYTTESCRQFWDCLSFFVFLQVHSGFIGQSLLFMFVAAPYLTFHAAVRFRLWSAPLQRLPKIGRHLWTKGVLRSIRAHNTVFEKFKNNHALNSSQLQIPALILTLSWPAGHIGPTYKESFQVHWENSNLFFSMLPPTSKYLYSVEPVRMHFPAKHQCTNDTASGWFLIHCWY